MSLDSTASRTRRAGLLVGAAGLVLLAGSCASSTTLGEVDRLMREGHYEEALHLAAAERDENPGSATAELAHRRATAGWYLEQGRRATFLDDDVAALDAFERAAEVLPDNPVVESWIYKTRYKLAEYWYVQAISAGASDELDEAAARYERAIEYWPDHSRAIQGYADVLVRINYRATRADDYYESSIRLHREYALARAKHDLQSANKYRPDDDRIARRVSQVERDLAYDHIALARDFELQGIYFAARNEYRIAQLVDPTNEEAAAGVEQMDVEIEVALALQECDMLIRREEFDRAEALLDEAQGKSPRQDDAIAAARERIEGAHWTELYDRALTYEHDFRYEEAVATYLDLLGRSGGFYGDARTRVDTLTSLIEQGQDLYAQALEAEDPEVALGLLRQVDLVWPEYADVSDRIAALEAQLEAGE